MGINNMISEKAKKSVISRLAQQGIDYRYLSDYEFQDLIENEIRKLKKVGLGFALGLAINLIGF